MKKKTHSFNESLGITDSRFPQQLLHCNNIYSSVPKVSQVSNITYILHIKTFMLKKIHLIFMKLVPLKRKLSTISKVNLAIISVISLQVLIS